MKQLVSDRENISCGPLDLHHGTATKKNKIWAGGQGENPRESKLIAFFGLWELAGVDTSVAVAILGPRG